MINEYPQVNSPDDVFPFCEKVKTERETDLQDWFNLPKRFISGRKVNKIPTSSSDVEAGDRLGDVNYTTSFLYILVYDDINNLNVWRRVALGAF